MEQPLQLLIIDDAQDDFVLLQYALNRAGLTVQARRVERAAEMEAALAARTWDVMLCDVHMPKFSADEALAIYHRHGLDIPFIVVSGAMKEEEAVDLLKSGAHDFVRKDNLSRLVPAIRRELQETEDRHRRNQAEEALRQANQRLLELNQVKDEFLTIMSHELRTPLNTILTISGVLQERTFGELNSKQLYYLEKLENSGKHLLSLIDEVLDISRIGAGKLELVVEPVSPRLLCQLALENIAPAAARKKLVVESDCGTTEMLRVDTRRVQQILVNLLDNAVKFTPEGGCIRLVCQADRADRQIRFEVLDSGIGIAEGQQSKVFEPFVQLDSGLSRKYEGMGLGLALVKRLTELHGGSVTLESRLGEGSRFSVSLPFNEASSSLPEVMDKMDNTS